MQLESLFDQKDGIQLDNKITILRPHDKQRSLIIARLLSQGSTLEEGAFYHSAAPTLQSLDAYVQDILDSFREQHREIRLQTRKSATGSAEAGQALGAAIGATGVRLIILDEVDNISMSENLTEFIMAFSNALPDDARLVLSGRALDFRAWQDAIDTGDASVFESNGERLDRRVEVYGFGIGTVYSDGKQVTVWDGPLPRSLFFYFTDHPLITRTEIFNTFWPDFPVKDATNVFHVTKRKVAERVGYETMIYSSGFYRQASDVTLYYDVADFEACISRGQTEPDDIEAWERAIHLYRAPFLHQMSMPWLVERRVKLAQDYTEALTNVGRHYEDHDPARALNLYLRAEREAPYREDIYRRAMQIYASGNQRDMVEQQYRALEARLKEAYNIQPGRATREMYESLTTTKGRR